jgi:zinc transport system substrate-binding protein
VVAGIAVALLCAACGSAQPAQQEGGVLAVSTVFPLAWIAEQVAPDAQHVFLGQGGQEPHDLELSPGDRQAVENADVLLYLGDIGFQPQVEQAVAEAASGEGVAVSEVVGEDALHAPDEGAHAHEETVDPHVWFDAGLMAGVAERTGEAFAAADPGGAATYEANATALAADLELLDRELAAVLSDCRFSEAIVSHEAYGYLLEPHGLAQRGIAGTDPEAGASPAQLAELTEQIRAAGITAVLTEPVEGRADAEALAQEAGVRLLEINPLEIVSDREFEVGYLELLRQQASTFAQALECAGAR